MAKNTKKIKGFKPETIKKIVLALSMLISYYRKQLEKGGFVGLVVSSGNSKIGRCMNVSLAPIVTCSNCSKCKAFCYDVKACCQYENVRHARAKNTALFQYNRQEFFNQLWTKMARKRTNKFLRFHVSGEIVDVNHFEYMVKTARMFPEFKIWTYTKCYGLVNEWIRENGGTREALPKNFSVMFSEWKGLPIVNPYGLPVFQCVDEGEMEPDTHHCPGCCDVCKALNMGCVAGQSSWTYLH